MNICMSDLERIGLLIACLSHDLDHRGEVIHLAWLVRIDANIGGGEHVQQTGIGNAAGEVHRVLEIHLLDHVAQAREPRSAAYARKVNVSATLFLQQRGHFEQ